MNKTVKAKKKLHECKNFSWTLITEGGGVIVRNLVKWWKGCFRTRENFEKLKKKIWMQSELLENLLTGICIYNIRINI